jgi:predicted transcriptional regulator
MRTLNFKQLMFDMDINQVGLAEILGISQSSMSKIIKGERSLQGHHLDKLIEKFGEGVVNNYYNHQNLETPSKMESTITIYDSETLEEIKQELREEDAIPVVPDVILSKRDINIQKYIHNCGSELSSIDPRELTNGAEFAMEILKDSMAPDLMQGDTVFLQFLPPEAKLHSGSPYFIDTPAYAGVIRDVYIDGNTMTLKARNHNFGDIILDMTKDTYTAANIVGMYRKSFNSAASQLEHMRREKDAQICRVLDVVERQAEQNGKLIDFITKEK